MCVCLFSCVLVSRVRDADVATDVLGSCVHSRSLLKKKWSDARAAWNFWIHEQGESTRLKIYFYVTVIWFHANPTLRDYRTTTSTWACCPCINLLLIYSNVDKRYCSILRQVPIIAAFKINVKLINLIHGPILSFILRSLEHWKNSGSMMAREWYLCKSSNLPNAMQCNS